MEPNHCDVSVANQFEGYHSGIRAPSNFDLRASSTTLPCQHCSDGRRERRWLNRRCYYYNNPGHQISNCKKKEDDEESQLIRLAINTGTQQQHDEDEDYRSGQKMEAMEVPGRKCGVVDIVFGAEKIRVQSVFYTQDIDRNVLSFDQLITQGFTVKFTGDKCKLFPTFGVPLNNNISMISGMTKEEEMVVVEKQKMMNKESEFMMLKTNFLNDYFKKLNVSSNEPDWNVMILQTMKFKDFLDCKALLDMMDDDEYVGKYKFILQTKFDEMVEWFITKKLGVTTRPIPAYASNNRKVCLLDLYLVIEREGGHRKVTENNLWPKVAKDIGFEYSDGELMRLMYAMYLDVLVYYHKFKVVQSNVYDKEVTDGNEVLGRKMDPRSSRSEGDHVEHDAVQAEKDEARQDVADKQSEHYALFTDNG
ncbi:putative transcription factor interactor and regulator CCHC(Zn) family [Helianthus annuus]|nr:putative transcription factor interactor and regulator CCHC(Zn) family [Helianthus annuus]